ncbi:hypothetical protein HYU14_07400 [Candidatus Woesearchaeota archaeon]|nr:hypothetical protein [Candidatus Woesearchaeota archaeon]
MGNEQKDGNPANKKSIDRLVCALALGVVVEGGALIDQWMQMAGLREEMKNLKATAATAVQVTDVNGLAAGKPLYFAELFPYKDRNDLYLFRITDEKGAKWVIEATADGH